MKIWYEWYEQRSKIWVEKWNDDAGNGNGTVKGKN
jgi:hypothetical protein